MKLFDLQKHQTDFEQLLSTFSSIDRSGRSILINNSNRCKKCVLCVHYSTNKNKVSETIFIKKKQKNANKIKTKLQKYGVYCT